MTHEPECPNTPHGLCICEQLRTAYQRGREDAAIAVAGCVRYDAGFGADSNWCHIRRNEALAAARGEGEQE